MTGINYDICYTQQRIYKYMCQQGYDMKTFSDAYLRSDFCRRAMDTNYNISRRKPRPFFKRPGMNAF